MIKSLSKKIRILVILLTTIIVQEQVSGVRYYICDPNCVDTACDESAEDGPDFCVVIPEGANLRFNMTLKHL